MSVIFQNLRAILPFFIGFWLLFAVGVLLGVQRFRNSFLLMAALFFSAMMLCCLFGDYMPQAMIILFLLVALAIFLVPAMLIFNGVRMLKKEGRSLANLLSLFFGIFIGVGEIATVVYVLHADMDLFIIRHELPVPGWLLAVTGTTVFYLCVVFLAFMFYAVLVPTLPYRRNFDYIIVHGCGLLRGDQVSPLLASRVDKAIEVFHRCGDTPILIPSGGQGGDETVSEAAAMEKYLLSHGIPANRILLEARSETTWENICNSRDLIVARGDSRRVALVSSNYHVYRCLTYAKQGKLKCVGIGAPVALYYWPSALIREFVAVFSKAKMLIWLLVGLALIDVPLILLYLGQ